MSNLGFGPATPFTPTVNYGSDLDCVTDLSATMNETSGLHMLAEALVRRLITPRGTLIDDANYGFDVRQYLGADLSPADVVRVGSGIDTELVKDERVIVSKTTISLTQPFGILNINTIVTPSAGPTFPFVLVVSQVTALLLTPTL